MGPTLPEQRRSLPRGAIGCAREAILPRTPLCALWWHWEFFHCRGKQGSLHMALSVHDLLLPIQVARQAYERPKSGASGRYLNEGVGPLCMCTCCQVHWTNSHPRKSPGEPWTTASEPSNSRQTQNHCPCRRPCLSRSGRQAGRALFVLLILSTTWSQGLQPKPAVVVYPGAARPEEMRVPRVRPTVFSEIGPTNYHT